MSHPNETVDDCSRVRSYVFVNKKRKRNLYDEFLRIFEEVSDQNLKSRHMIDGLSCALCDTCYKRVE